MENITIRTTDRFIEIVADDGYVMTDWNGDDIMDYTSTKVLICPVNYDYSVYRTITDEQDAEYVERQIAEIEKGA
jgi:hypothetical protein